MILAKWLSRNCLRVVGLFSVFLATNVVAQIDTDPINNNTATPDPLPLLTGSALANNARLISGTNGDVDFFSVPVTAGEIIIGMVTPISGLPTDFGIPDTLVRTRQGSSVLTLNDDDGGGTFPLSDSFGSMFRVVASSTGTIEIGVSGSSFPDPPDVNFNGSHTEVGNYILTVGRINPSVVGGNFADTDPTNNTRAGADVITLGPSRAAIAVAELSSSGSDVDFFQLTLKAGDVLSAMTAPLQGLSGSFNVPDTRLALFDSAGTIIVFNDDAGAPVGVEFNNLGSDNPGDIDFVLGDGLRALIVSDGIYYLGVTGFNDADFNGTDDDLSGLSHGIVGRYALLVSVPEPAVASLLCAGFMWIMFGYRRNRFS